MDSLIQTFHIDIKILIAQIINFGIAFAVLYFFALKPLAKAMKERSDKIAKGIDQTKEIEEKLAQTSKDYKSEIAKAKKEANEILEKAKGMADERGKEIIIRAKEQIAQLIEQEKVSITSERGRALKEIKAEIADLVAESLNKILVEKFDLSHDREFIKKLASEINHEAEH